MYRWMLAGLMTIGLLWSQNAQDSRKAYGSAVADFNAGRIPEAKEKLAALLAADPDYFRGYALYWRAVARCDGEERQAQVVEQALSRFAAIPPEKRTEDFYYAYADGFKDLKRDDEARRITAEAIARYPKGGMAQSAILDSARKEQDPRRAAQIYRDYMNRFEDNVSWCEIAARDRFWLMSGHRDQFSKEDLVEAAARWESAERAFAREFGPDARYPHAAGDIARALLDLDPALSYSYASKAAGFVAQEWAKSQSMDSAYQATFWPLMLEAAVAAKYWPAAERVGKASMQEIDAGRLFAQMNEIAEEAKVRKLYADALDHRAHPVEAARERDLAAGLADEKSTVLAAARERRMGKLKDEILATEVNRPASPFRLKMLDGKEVALADYRGKAVVLAFWATWCGPCQKELEELDRLNDRFRDNPRAALLTVSIDDAASTVTEYLAKKGFRFPIVKSDATIESAYDTSTIPQLYVIDRDGNVRFQMTGFDDDGTLGRRLEWMIDAVSR
jgi:peroxiredoxin